MTKTTAAAPPPNPPKTLKEALRRNGQSQQAIADEVGVDQSYISQIVHGKRQPSLKVALHLEAITGVSAKDLLYPPLKAHLARRLKRRTA